MEMGNIHRDVKDRKTKVTLIRNKARGLTVLHIKMCDKAIATRTMACWHEDKQIDQ